MTGPQKSIFCCSRLLGLCLQAAAAVRPRNRPLVVMLEGAEGTGASALKDLIILLAEVCPCLLQHNMVPLRALQVLHSCSFRRAQHWALLGLCMLLQPAVACLQAANIQAAGAGAQPAACCAGDGHVYLGRGATAVVTPGCGGPAGGAAFSPGAITA